MLSPSSSWWYGRSTAGSRGRCACHLGADELHRQPNAHARRRRTPLGILLAGTVHRAGGGHPRSQRGSDGSFDLLGASLLVAKILTELILIPISFAVQRRWVFLPTQRQENTREKTQAIAASSGLRAVSYESTRMEAAGIRTGVRASQVRP